MKLSNIVTGIRQAVHRQLQDWYLIGYCCQLIGHRWRTHAVRNSYDHQLGTVHCTRCRKYQKRNGFYNKEQY